MHLIWHMRESLIFAYVAQSHGERELVECGAHPLSPHVIVPHGANMRGTLICHMRCIFLIYIYIGAGSTENQKILRSENFVREALDHAGVEKSGGDLSRVFRRFGGAV